MLLIGDCKEKLKEVPDNSVDCCITSPPYFNLRDYGEGGQIGLEKATSEYLVNLLQVFKQIKRILKPTGTLWLNLGDTYAQKQLVGIPWKAAIALQNNKWRLRQDIIWHKPNPMPESVRDRCTKSHEYIFLLSKQERYYFDADAIAEPAQDRGACIPESLVRVDNGFPGACKTRSGGTSTGYGSLETRNKRSVWTVTTKPYAKAHFATFPPDLILPCVLAGTSEHGCCAACGMPWERDFKTLGKAPSVGWIPTCTCHTNEVVPAKVIDPFFGSGTTGAVADALGREWIGVELNPEYAKMYKDRFDEVRKFIRKRNDGS